MALAARMNAATYPDADHRARTRPMMPAIPAVPALPCTWLTTECRNEFTPPGATCPRLLKIVFVVDLPSIPRTETSTSMAGNSASTP